MSPYIHFACVNVVQAVCVDLQRLLINIQDKGMAMARRQHVEEGIQIEKHACTHALWTCQAAMAKNEQAAPLNNAHESIPIELNLRYDQEHIISQSISPDSPMPV